MNLEALLDEHAGHIALQFSGGRDSLAMLLFMRRYLDRVTVYYTNSGDVFPETLALAHAVRDSVRNFIEIPGKVKEVQAQYGWPSDIVPAGAAWHFGKDTIKGHIPLIDRYDCCLKSIMKPTHDKMCEDGITLILRGQRATDEPKSHIKNGETVDGFTIAYPIVDWTTEDVMTYIEQQGVQPPPLYAEGATTTSDCMHCTAWLETKTSKYLNKFHPEVAREVNARLAKIKVIVEPHLKSFALAQEHLNGE